MKTKLSAFALASTLVGRLCLAQTNKPAVEDFKPSMLNQPGKQSPRSILKGASAPVLLPPRPKASCSSFWEAPNTP